MPPKSKLSQGWQARVRLIHRDDNGVSVEKSYGTHKNWTHQEAVEVLTSARRFQQWLSNNGLFLSTDSFIELETTKTGFLVKLEQPYLGPDCELELLEARNNRNVRAEGTKLLDKLLSIIGSVSDGFDLAFRTEIKPADFCRGENNELVLVDTFPPVLACDGGKLMAAYRSHESQCLITKERQEILDITGSPEGMVRNLCEHMIAILPNERRLWIDQSVAFTRRCDLKIGRNVEARLNSEESQKKIDILRARKEKRIRL